MSIDFTDDLRTSLAGHLANHERTEQPLDGRKHAAVAIVLVDSDAELHEGDPLFDDEHDPVAQVGDVRMAEGGQVRDGFLPDPVVGVTDEFQHQVHVRGIADPS